MMAPTAAECAQALLDVVPEVMQAIRRHVRHQRGRDLSVLQLRTLAFLAGHPGAPLSAVAEHVGLTLPSMSTQVSNLVERQLLSRTTLSTDRRYVTLHVTEPGAAILATVRENAQDSLAAAVAHLSPEERGQVIAALRILRTIFPENSEP